MWGVLALPVPPVGVGEAAGWLVAPLRPVPPPGCESGAPGTGRGWWGSPRSPPETAWLRERKHPSAAPATGPLLSWRGAHRDKQNPKVFGVNAAR